MVTEIKTADLPEKLIELMEGYKPDEHFVSNGCSYAPDEFGGIDIRPACHYHDWAYHLGGCARTRKGADQMLYRNLRKCGLSSRMAGIYYRRVRLWGVNAFRWKKGYEPSKPWCYLWLFFERYVQW
jgi:hypothetical protein